MRLSSDVKIFGFIYFFGSVASASERDFVITRLLNFSDPAPRGHDPEQTVLLEINTDITDVEQKWAIFGL